MSLYQGAVERIQAVSAVHQSAIKTMALAASISKRLQPVLRLFEDKQDAEATKALDDLVFTSFFAFRLGHDLRLGSSKDGPKKSLAKKQAALFLLFLRQVERGGT